MTIARRAQVSLDHTCFYHCSSRCVRRAFLCGVDAYSGQNFDHRRRWIEDRLNVLVEVFAIELAAYAVMSNHYHVILRINAQRAAQWSNEEVIERWGRLFSVAEASESKSEEIARWRERLQDVSWFMRCINEPIARRANREDDCKGRFWEGRFRSQALLDETAVLKCMAYVDLNPIRAGICELPERAEYTSARARILGRDHALLPFADQMRNSSEPESAVLSIRRLEYLQLLDWSGRIVRSDKRGQIPTNAPAILARLGLTNREWANDIRHYGRWYYRAVGATSALQAYCDHLGQQWLWGMARPALATPA